MMMMTDGHDDVDNGTEIEDEDEGRMWRKI